MDGLSSPKWPWLEWLDDGGLMLLAVLAIPLVILAVGAPIGLVAWLISFIVQQF